MKKIIYIILAAFSLFACDDYFDDGGIVSTEPLKMNTLEFLKSRPDLFDSTLMVIERSGLADLISSEEVTFFVPQKNSISNVLNSINSFVRDKRDSLGYTKDTVLFEDVPAESWADYLSHYIFKGRICRDDIRKGNLIYDDNKNYIVGGEMRDSFKGHKMMLLCNHTDWEGVPEAGPRYIYLIETKGTDVTDPETADYRSVSVITSNIQTSSGVVHILSRNHEFGFGNSENFIPAK